MTGWQGTTHQGIALASTLSAAHRLSADSVRRLTP
jgi:hypothetical protein